MKWCALLWSKKILWISFSRTPKMPSFQKYVICTWICGIIVALGASLTEAVTYHRKMTPKRVRVGQPVLIEAWMEDYTTPIGRVEIINPLYSANNFFVASGACGTERLTFNETADSAVTQVLCDHTTAKYSFRIQKVLGDVTWYVRVMSQEPSQSELYYIRPYLSPTEVKISKNPGLTKAGDQLEILCVFEDGISNLANFTLERIKTKKSLTPDGSQYYGNAYGIRWHAEPGDEGWYRCKAVYDPPSVGEYISSPVYVNVTYTPQLDHSKDLIDYVEADIGQNASFTVPVLANPDAHATWTRGTELLEDDDRFHIEERKSGPGEHEFVLSFFVEDGDYGLYKCQLKNNLGQEMFYFHLAKQDLDEKTWAQTEWTGAVTALVILVIPTLLGVLGLWFLIFWRRRQRNATRDRNLTNSIASNPGCQSDRDKRPRPKRAIRVTGTENPNVLCNDRGPPLPPKNASSHQARSPRNVSPPPELPPPEPADNEYEDMSGLLNL